MSTLWQQHEKWAQLNGDGEEGKEQQHVHALTHVNGFQKRSGKARAASTTSAATISAEGGAKCQRAGD